MGDEEIAEYAIDAAGVWASAPLRRYIPGAGIDERIAQANNGSVSNPPKSYYHTNHQGSVIAMTTATGAVSEKLAYDAYGNLTSEPPAVSTGQVFRYTGRRFDEETGLYYYRARYYSPLWGRFLQVDPIGYRDDFNLYAYVGNDPLNVLDPFGEAGCADAAVQGLPGICLDASAYNEKKDGSQTVVSMTDVDAKAIEVASSLEDKNTERATIIDRNQDGTLTAGNMSQGADNANGQQTAVIPTTSTVAVEHSHPNNPNYGIEPGYHGRGQGDHRAVEAGYPNYITRDGKVIVIERSGGQYRVRVVNGKLSAAEAKEVRRALNYLQRDSRSRGQ